MSRFTVILPEGTVILKNEETGQILRLSAESGPLVLGEIEMSMTLGPRPSRLRVRRTLPPLLQRRPPPVNSPPGPPIPWRTCPTRPSCPDPRRLTPHRFRPRFRGPRA